eukprot:COSAG03_NODE_272_length_9583_cov_5.194538_3_plen_76_part_00
MDVGLCKRASRHGMLGDGHVSAAIARCMRDLMSAFSPFVKGNDAVVMGCNLVKRSAFIYFPPDQRYSLRTWRICE